MLLEESSDLVAGSRMCCGSGSEVPLAARGVWEETVKKPSYRYVPTVRSTKKCTWI